ncbi:MAG: hypothetical protein ACLSDQ_07690 [Adlercreutzia equolifaciens]
MYFDQGEDAPIAFYEEALSQVPRAKKGGLHRPRLSPSSSWPSTATW